MLPVLAPNAFGNNRFGDFWGNHNINEDSGGFAGSATLLAALLVFTLRARKRRPQEILVAGLAVASFIVVSGPPGFALLATRLPLLDMSPTSHRRILLLLAFFIVYLAACTWERWLRGGLPRAQVWVMTGALAALVTWGYLGLGGILLFLMSVS